MVNPSKSCFDMLYHSSANDISSCHDLQVLSVSLVSSSHSLIARGDDSMPCPPGQGVAG